MQIEEEVQSSAVGAGTKVQDLPRIRDRFKPFRLRDTKIEETNPGAQSAGTMCISWVKVEE